MSKFYVRMAAAAVLATVVLTACGRNPGARARSYPGMEKIEEAIAAAEPKCVRFEAKRIGTAAVVTGKEKFAAGRRGVYTLESFRVSQAADRIDRMVSSSVFRMTEFGELSGPAPRVAIEAECLDLKGEGLSLSLSPVTEIDSSTGRILGARPLSLEVAANGRIRAKTKGATSVPQSPPAGKVPEAALLLGAAYAETLSVLSFRVKEAEDGSLSVEAEFVGMDSKLSRLFIRVEAVYGWDSAE